MQIFKAKNKDICLFEVGANFMGKKHVQAYLNL